MAIQRLYRLMLGLNRSYIYTHGLDKHFFESEIENILLSLNLNIFYLSSKEQFLMLLRDISLRRFFRVPTPYVLIEK